MQGFIIENNISLLYRYNANSVPWRLHSASFPYIVAFESPINKGEIIQVALAF